VARTTVVQGIQGSLEYRTKLVNDTYLQYLGRRADPQGLQMGLSILAGTPLYVGAAPGLVQLRLRLLSSPEYFQNRGGNTNAGFVAALFQDVVGRPVDPANLARYLGQLAGGTPRASVASQVLTSVEGTEHTVDTYFRLYLRRPADRPALDGFGGALRRGTKEEDVIRAIVASAEYFGRL
jgi:hypothetical protein